MDDFRVESVPSSDLSGHRQTSGAITRKREKHRDDQHGEQDDEADVFEPMENEADAAGEPIEDYYLPSDPSRDGD